MWTLRKLIEQMGVTTHAEIFPLGELCAICAYNSLPLRQHFFHAWKYFFLPFIFDKGHVVNVQLAQTLPYTTACISDHDRH